MADYYADSSVLVKRHVNEIGSDWFRALADPTTGNVIITSRVSIIEVYSAFNRRVREASLSPLDYAQLAADFASIYGTEYQVVELTVVVADRAHIPAIALTGYAGVEEGERALSAGFQVHLPKPAEPSSLVNTIAHLCGRSGKERSA